jgi:DNA (cytosine-5)-methyltransferase 1
MSEHSFQYVDLFAGIGGFHAVLDAMGGECVYAVEIDKEARAVYRANWGIDPIGANKLGDITQDTATAETAVPPHDVLVAGFPCQPFSKSGKQQGMDETRGTLFFNIMEIIRHRQPAVVLLENVRNLAGPRHVHEWKVIVEKLREAGYRVSHKSDILSPNKFAPAYGGHPQTRDRVFIAATRVEPKFPSEEYLRLEGSDFRLPDPMAPFDIPLSFPGLGMQEEWSLVEHLPIDESVKDDGTVSPTEWKWIDHWDALVQQARRMFNSDAERNGSQPERLPGFPIWANVWTNDLDARASALQSAADMAW